MSALVKTPLPAKEFNVFYRQSKSGFYLSVCKHFANLQCSAKALEKIWGIHRHW